MLAKDVQGGSEIGPVMVVEWHYAIVYAPNAGIYHWWYRCKWCCRFCNSKNTNHSIAHQTHGIIAHHFLIEFITWISNSIIIVSIW